MLELMIAILLGLATQTYNTTETNAKATTMSKIDTGGETGQVPPR